MVLPSLYPPSRPQSIGEILDAGLRLFRATLGHCLPYGALLVIADQLGNFNDLFFGRLPSVTLEHDRVWWTWYGVGIVISLLLWGALLLRQDALARRRPISMTAELAASLRKFPQLVALTLIAWIAITLGLLLLVAPGVYLAVALAFGAPALFVGGASGPVRALTESLRLVRGEWRRTALLIVLVISITLVAYVLLVAILAAALAAIAVTDVTDVRLLASFSEFVGVIAGSITAPFGSAMILTIYADLVRRAELRRETTDSGATASSGADPTHGGDNSSRVDARAGNR